MPRRVQHYVPTPLCSTIITRFFATTRALTPTGPFNRQPWFPDSHHLNFQTFHLQSSADLRQSRSTSSALTALFCYGLRHCYAGSPVPPTETSSRCSLLGIIVTDCLFISSCSPPGVIAPAQLLSITGLQCRPRQGLSPCCSSVLSGAHSPAF